MKKLEGKKLELARLFELIAQTNKALERHHAYPDSDILAIQQLLKLKNRYSQELFALLGELELDFALAA